jgi:hypothetical protein
MWRSSLPENFEWRENGMILRSRKQQVWKISCINRLSLARLKLNQPIGASFTVHGSHHSVTKRPCTDELLCNAYSEPLNLNYLRKRSSRTSMAAMDHTLPPDILLGRCSGIRKNEGGACPFHHRTVLPYDSPSAWEKICTPLYTSPNCIKEE